MKRATMPSLANQVLLLVRISLWVLFLVGMATAADLPQIKEKGVLRHLGVPYANFVTGSGDGLDVEMVKLFAGHLGVEYEYVPTTWSEVIADVSGKEVVPDGEEITVVGEKPVRGHIAASGLTILPWREKVVDFSVPTFPNQVWLVARADAPIQPIKPCGDSEKDVVAVKLQLKGCEVLGIPNTCLDPKLYGLNDTGAIPKPFHGTLNELVPAVINGEAMATIQDVSDALMAVEKWPGKIKVIGPISAMQNMGYAFNKTSPGLRQAFNQYFEQCRRDGTYTRLVAKYYPAILKYYPDFFAAK